MPRNHRKLAFLLVIFLVSATSMTGCRSPATRKAAVHQLEFATEAFSERFLKSAAKQSDDETAEAIIRAARQNSGLLDEVIQPEYTLVINSAYKTTRDSLLTATPDNANLDYLKQVASQTIQEDAQLRKVSLSPAQVDSTADQIARLTLVETKIYIQAYMAAVNQLSSQADEANLEDLRVVAYEAANNEARRWDEELNPQLKEIINSRLDEIASAVAAGTMQQYQQNRNEK